MDTKFLTNYSEIRFIDKIIDSLNKCDSFSFSVSFIKFKGLQLIYNAIEAALIRGAKGRIITSTYQNFTDVSTLNSLLDLQQRFDNFKCHLDYKSFGDNGFHTKGYLFEYNNCYETIIGSSNITTFALLKNIEWNVSIVNKDKNSLNLEIEKEWDNIWNQTELLDSELIRKYSIDLDYAIERWDMDYESDFNSIRPNSMQRKALKEIRKFRDRGEDKALVIAATGSGKTYLAAFDAKNFDAKRLLFIVHRDTVLVEAMKTFSKIFGSTRSYGLFTGKEKTVDADFLFASNLMISKNKNMFDKDYFDYIIIDEVHHAAASTYQEIINYFKPQFLLGLTATPERMDNKDVFSIFENNIPYELRLRDALLNDLVVPFKYYGIRDTLINYDDNFDFSKLSKQLSEETHCEFISKEIEKHRPKGKLKAIGFCRNKEHAREMAKNMEQLGYSTTYIDADSSTGERLKKFNDLQDEGNPLEIIFAIDTLNEGVDIPAINMVLFLRPTDSATIFIQQLGRGLRKYIGKEYLTVLDFIGNNYQRSVQIAMALSTLSNSSNLDKHAIKAAVLNDFKGYNLPIEIHIDQLSKEEILRYIEKVNFNSKNILFSNYKSFKKYLHLDTYPKHMDYLYDDCAPNLIRFLKSSTSGNKNRSYYKFLSSLNDKERDLPNFNNSEIELIDAISDLLPLVRKDEYLIISSLLDGKDINLKEYTNINANITKDSLNHALDNLVNKKILLKDEKYRINVDNINQSLNDYLKDLLMYGLSKYDLDFQDFEGDYKLYNEYYKDQIRMIKLKNIKSAYMLGTEYDKNGETYLYVNLNKKDDDKESYDYKDKFISNNMFQWESVNNTTLTNSEGKKLLNTKFVHLFIRKRNDENGIRMPYVYFGRGKLTNPKESFNEVIDKGNIVRKPTLIFDVVLDNPVPNGFDGDYDIPKSEEV